MVRPHGWAHCARIRVVVVVVVVVVFGVGPVGLFAAKCAWLMGAGRVIVVDHLDYRLAMARTFAHAETLDFTQVDDVKAAVLGVRGDAFCVCRGGALGPGAPIVAWRHSRCDGLSR